jgi:hypothetical protein
MRERSTSFFKKKEAKKIFAPVAAWPLAARRHGPREQKFFASFFQKRSFFLA